MNIFWTVDPSALWVSSLLERLSDFFLETLETIQIKVLLRLLGSRDGPT